MQLWQSPISRLSQLFNWLAEHLPEAWMFSSAVYIVWHPVFGDRAQNTICVAGLMSVATALVRLKKIEHKIDEMRATQLLREGRTQAKLLKRLKKHEHEEHEDDEHLGET